VAFNSRRELTCQGNFLMPTAGTGGGVFALR